MKLQVVSIVKLVTPLPSFLCCFAFIVPAPVQTVRFASSRTDNEWMVNHVFVEARGAGFLCAQNHKGRCRALASVSQSINGPTSLQDTFSSLQWNPWTHGKVSVDIIQNQMYSIIVVTVTDSVLGLVVDFKDVSGRAFDWLYCVGQQSAAKEYLGRVLYENWYVYPMRVLDPFASIVMNRNGNARWERCE